MPYSYCSRHDEIRAAIKVIETKHQSTNTENDSFRDEMRSDTAMVEQKVDPLAGKFDLVEGVERLKMQGAELKRLR